MCTNLPNNFDFRVFLKCSHRAMDLSKNVCGRHRPIVTVWVSDREMCVRNAYKRYGSLIVSYVRNLYMKILSKTIFPVLIVYRSKITKIKYCYHVIS